LVLLAACVDSSPDDPENRCDNPPTPVAIDSSGTRSFFVVDTILVPSSATEATQYAFNLDGDELGRIDNRLGQILAALAGGGGVDLNAETQLLIESGELLHLLEIQTTSREFADGVAVSLFHGVDLDADPSDNFSGTEPFAADLSRGRGLMSGNIVDGVVTVEMGNAPLAVTLPGLGESFVINLKAATLTGTFTDTGFAGRIGGAMSADVINGMFMTLFHLGLSRSVEGDCDENGVCVPDSTGETVLGLFDTSPNDHRISFEEVAESDLVQSLFRPDVDLFNDDGEFAPLCDGEKESLSVGLAFTAVRANVGN